MAETEIRRTRARDGIVKKSWKVRENENENENEKEKEKEKEKGGAGGVREKGEGRRRRGKDEVAVRKQKQKHKSKNTAEHREVNVHDRKPPSSTEDVPIEQRRSMEGENTVAEEREEIGGGGGGGEQDDVRRGVKSRSSKKRRKVSVVVQERELSSTSPQQPVPRTPKNSRSAIGNKNQPRRSKRFLRSQATVAEGHGTRKTMEAFSNKHEVTRDTGSSAKHSLASPTKGTGSPKARPAVSKRKAARNPPAPWRRTRRKQPGCCAELSPRTVKRDMALIVRVEVSEEKKKKSKRKVRGRTSSGGEIYVQTPSTGGLASVLVEALKTPTS
ncbi:hypothetical protein CERZMDRAFT_102894 [Cercospora zeae-maydis SCOH1-5]|uniref:Uncharacterized protein n=1 Tax=Cercospora zeae-maydis SCOH1-5 TaxID=717836 RepID=A0A6A6EXI8_9PEZI|nr:hypothetical protein CERZMDRAFT_102894 [Cercospora zeae-maydis SCOH1-5]